MITIQPLDHTAPVEPSFIILLKRIFFAFQNHGKSASMRSLRLESHRRALVWQKKYLMLIVNQFQMNDEKPFDSSLPAIKMWKRFRYRSVSKYACHACVFNPPQCSVTRLDYLPIGLWANFQSLWQQLICPFLLPFLGIFCKGVNIIHFSSKIIFGLLLQKFGNFYLVTLQSTYSCCSLLLLNMGQFPVSFPLFLSFSHYNSNNNFNTN